MKKVFLLLLLSVIFFAIEISRANDQITPCKYVLDLANEKCCEEGGNCCGPFNCK